MAVDYTGHVFPLSVGFDWLKMRAFYFQVTLISYLEVSPGDPAPHAQRDLVRAQILNGVLGPRWPDHSPPEIAVVSF